MRWAPQEVAAFVVRGGSTADDDVTAVAVALATSGGDDAWSWQVPGAPWLDRIGLWGIRPADAAGVDPGTLYDPLTNARAAYELWLGAGRSWSWAPAFANGEYRRFVEAAADAVSHSVGWSRSAPPVPTADLDGAGRSVASAARRALEGLDGATSAFRSLR